MAQDLVLDERFDGNKANWVVLNSVEDDASIQKGAYQWKHSAEANQSIFNYINRLDVSRNFVVKVKIKNKKIGSEHGVFWGGIDGMNGNYFLLKGKSFRVCQMKDGSLNGQKNYQPSIKVGLLENELKIEKKGNEVSYYLNGKQVHHSKNLKVLGKAFGFSIWNKGSIAVESYEIRGTLLPINLVPDLYYETPPENLGQLINSKFDELTPLISPSGKRLYFSRRMHPSNVGGPGDEQDAYYSDLKNGVWEKPVNLSRPINDQGPNVVCAVTPDENQLLLLNTYNPKGQTVGRGLSISSKEATGWGVPKNVRMVNYYNRDLYEEFFLNNDGNVMLLALKRDETHGNKDIYVSFKQGDLWSEPVNLGAQINTGGREFSPFLASDGKTLYFSSTGHPGYGKNDIFISKRLDDSWQAWSEPQNLGNPINSAGRDAYYSVPAEGDFAYFVSSKDSYGFNDIFRIALPKEAAPEPVILIYGTVYNSKTKETLGAKITYQDIETDKTVGIAHSDPTDGSYKIVLPLKKFYSFFAEKTGFYSVRDNIDLKNVKKQYQEIRRDLYLSPIEFGQTILLNNVFFVQSKASLLDGSYQELDKLLSLLEENPEMIIELGGHTDNVGDPKLNTKLSEDRAQTVKEYLVGRGVTESRIVCKGYGGSVPLASNRYENTRRLNRRVEFKILQNER